MNRKTEKLSTYFWVKKKINLYAQNENISFKLIKNLLIAQAALNSDRTCLFLQRGIFYLFSPLFFMKWELYEYFWIENYISELTKKTFTLSSKTILPLQCQRIFLCSDIVCLYNPLLDLSGLVIYLFKFIILTTVLSLVQ